MKNTDEVYQFYLDKSIEVLSKMTDAVILKTDTFNEVIHEGRSFIKPILGQLPNVKEAYAVEILPARAEEARKRVGDKATIITGDLTKVEFERSQFDAILDLSTIDHIHPLDVEDMIKKYALWLKTGGKLLIVAWLNYNTKWKEVPRDANPNSQYYFNADDFLIMLWNNSLPIIEREKISGSKAAPWLEAFVCRKVSI